MNRRTFLKIVGMGSVSLVTGCSSETEKHFYSLVEAPFDMVTGEAAWYASVCRECPAGCGILAKNREGRVIKVEGNPLHPINRGSICMRGQAAVQGLFNPDRLKTPLLKEKGGWRSISFSHARSLLKEKISQSVAKGDNKVRLVTEVVGDHLFQLMKASLDQWQSSELHVFEPLAYEALKTANQTVFGHGQLPSYSIQQADFLLSFGADFLETWLSPVEYARKFKEMHCFRNGGKGVFVHVGPYQSLTGANADLWLKCRPGTEAMVALGLLREVCSSGKDKGPAPEILMAVKKISGPFTKDQVCLDAGIDPVQYENVLAQLQMSRRPLILGTGAAGQGQDACLANMGANLLNLILDPNLSLFDFSHTHQVGMSSARSEILALFKGLESDPDGLLLLNNVNPVFHFSAASGVKEALENPALFVVSFSNFLDETSRSADLVFPTQYSLETWDEYSGKKDVFSMLQPAMGPLYNEPGLGDILIATAFGTEDRNNGNTHSGYKARIVMDLLASNRIKGERDWVEMLRNGGDFKSEAGEDSEPSGSGTFHMDQLQPDSWIKAFESLHGAAAGTPALVVAPSLRFFDGRGANRPWLCEIPDPQTCVAWQTPVLMHPHSLARNGLTHGDIIDMQSEWGKISGPVYESHNVAPGVLLISMGQGHEAYGRYAKGVGVNPLKLLPHETAPLSGGPLFFAEKVEIQKKEEKIRFAHTDGSRTQYGRKIALSVDVKELIMPEEGHEASTGHTGTGMWEFPLTLPLPQGYDANRDIYSPHSHPDYRWAMVIDLDKCIGCAACAAACYAENNLGVVGEEQIINGREMAWLSVHRYLDPEHPDRPLFLPMMCQHCDNAPCESVCPVYAPHHSKEGLNNQIYNRCIGTRFCSQNCPYKVRRFNWFDWRWPRPLHLQLNPDVTVRSKGVMEKCSFCVQRIKFAHDTAKNNGRRILDGEIQPACLQACPTGALTFGNILDENSRVRKLAEDKRSYQVMGYLNTKPAVIYLKKVVQKI